jgi:predicted Zn-dependent peptidase
VHIETLAAAFERAFSARGRDEQAIHTWAPTEVGNASRTHVPVEDRANLDVRLGHGLPVRRTDQDYLPLFVGNFILGGNFSGRLMSHVRDEKGLTYGIGSALSGITAQHDGVWRIAVTLSADKLEAGIQATRETLERFLQEGPSAKEVSRAIATLSGQYVVGLATTSGLASTLRAHADNGFPVAYIDQYPEELAALTPTSVCEAVRKHLRPESLRVVSAGSAL